MTQPSLTDFSPSTWLQASVHYGMTILDLLDSLPWFRTGADWTAWRAFLAAVYGLPMTDEEHSIYQRCTGRKDPPTKKAREVWVPTGRRARKSAIAAAIGVWEGALARTYDDILAPGERALIPMLAKNKGDAHTMRDYVVAMLRSSKALKTMVEGEPKVEEIHLITRVDFEIKAASLTAGRSRTIPCALLDEIAFFGTDEAAITDTAIVEGIRPAQLLVPDPLVVAMSSPYARRGLLWQAYKNHYSVEGDPILVWMADTVTMHDLPKVRVEIDAAFRADPTAAASEYGRDGIIKFRDDVSALVTEEVLDAVIQKGVVVVPYNPERWYQAFVDVSGGSHDSFGVAISHWEPDELKVVLDHVFEVRAPFNTSDVVAAAADVLKSYGIDQVTGDKYAKNWPVDRFMEHGIDYKPTEEPKSDIYLAWLPMLNAGRLKLLDHPKMRDQFLALDRRPVRGGRDSIDHPPGGYDDVANCVAGATLKSDRERLPKRDYVPPPTSLQDLRSREWQEHLSRVRAGKVKREHDYFPGA